MFFLLHDSRSSYISSSEIDLHMNPPLQLLQFNSSLDIDEIRKSQDDVIIWLNLICESITSTSLVVGMKGFSKEAEICDKIQETLLALYERLETFSVYLPRGTKEQGQFSKLYEAGIVVHGDIELDDDKQVGSCDLASYLLSSFLSYLALPILPLMSFYFKLNDISQHT